jgi:hypothetical protein
MAKKEVTDMLTNDAAHVRSAATLGLIAKAATALATAKLAAVAMKARGAMLCFRGESFHQFINARRSGIRRSEICEGNEATMVTRLWSPQLFAGLAALHGIVSPRCLAIDAGPSPEVMEQISVDELKNHPYVIRDKALLINLSAAKTPGDWLKIPGVKGAWRKTPGQRGKTVLQDADGDGVMELYGEGGSKDPSRSLFWRHDANGAARWETPIHRGSEDNNGVQCEDLDLDGDYEAVCLGSYLTVMDAEGGDIVAQRCIFHDMVGSADVSPEESTLRFDHPYRLAHCTDKKKYNIVVGNGYSPDGQAKKGKHLTYAIGGVQVVCYNPDGKIAWHYKHAGKGYEGGGHELRVHDLDGDGFDEVIYSANGGLVCINHDGSERWRHDGWGMHSDWIEIDDVTGDGKLDMVVQQGGPAGHFYILDASVGQVLRKIPNQPKCEVQNFAAASYRPELKGKQLALTTIGEATLRLIDLATGEYLTFPVGAAEAPTIRRWNDLDMYNCASHDADGDGVEEVFTYTTPKPYQLERVGKVALPKDAAKALTVGVAAFRGDGSLAQYWNFYSPRDSGVVWGVHHWEMRQFVAPERKFDIDDNGIEEAYIETEPWVLLVEIADLGLHDRGLQQTSSIGSQRAK